VLHIHCLEASCIFAFSDWRSNFTHPVSSQNLPKNSLFHFCDHALVYIIQFMHLVGNILSVIGSFSY
jgi:hypothetical protein